jgi:hypothetical protein
VVAGFVFDWWDQADLAVQAAVVVPIGVLGDGDLEVVDRLPGSAVAFSVAGPQPEDVASAGDDDAVSRVSGWG